MPRLREAIGAVGRTLRLMVGLPDYGAYVAHRQAQHPGEPILTAEEFHHNRTERRFGGGAEGISRCC